jgi:hypothetical protein
MAKRSSSTDRKVSAAFHEVYHKVPKTVKATGKTGAAKTAMIRAVALSKARAAGADIPSMRRGGVVPHTGVFNMHKGEKVIPASIPKVQSLPYGQRGEEAPGTKPGTYDRLMMNPYEEEGFSHLRPHTTEI